MPFAASLRGYFDEPLGLQFGGVRRHQVADAPAIQFGQAIRLGW